MITINKNIDNDTLDSILTSTYYNKAYIDLKFANYYESSYIDSNFVPHDNATLELKDGNLSDLPVCFFAHKTTGFFYEPFVDGIVFVVNGFPQFVIGNTFITPAVPLLGQNGTNVLPSFSFINDPSTGMYLFTPGVLGFASGGNYKLTISNNFVTTYNPILHQKGTAAAPTITFFQDTNTGLYSDVLDTVKFSTAGTNRLSLTTTALTSTLPLLLPDGTVSDPAIAFASDTDTGFFNLGSGNLAVSCGGVLQTIFSPTETFFPGIATFTGTTVNFNPTGNYNIIYSLGGTTTLTYNEVTRMYYNDASETTFYSTSDFTYTGNSTELYNADKTITCGNIYRIQDGASGGYFSKSATNLWRFYRDTNTSTTSVLQLLSDVGGTEIINWVVLGNGDTKSTTGVYTTLSDKRLKTNIEPVKNGYLEDLKKLKVKHYKLKHDPQSKKRIGLVVQDLEEASVFPDLIDESECTLSCDCDKNCHCGECENPIHKDETGNRYHAKGLLASNIPYILIKAIQELEEQVADLRSQIASLKI